MYLIVVLIKERKYLTKFYLNIIKCFCFLSINLFNKNNVISLVSDHYCLMYEQDFALTSLEIEV